jgi:hypothetical protein
VLFDEGFTFRNFLVDVFSVFMFFIWLWLLFRVFSDLFSRHDVSGLGKVLWVICLIALPYIGIFAYILTQGRGMAQRDEAHIEQARANLRKAIGFSVADELEKLGRLKAQGEISEQEYARLGARVLG